MVDVVNFCHYYYDYYYILVKESLPRKRVEYWD